MHQGAIAKMTLFKFDKLTEHIQKLQTQSKFKRLLAVSMPKLKPPQSRIPYCSTHFIEGRGWVCVD
jgi:hypothetical protein